ncbi:MAG: helical backbone metal receptor, partial [Planctomycetota bacterium]
MPTRTSIIHRLACTVLLAGMAACGRSPAVPPATPAGMRIISLSPALTRTVSELGGGAAIVGRTPWCETPQAPDARIVGSLEDRDLEAIAALRPTLVLRQSSVTDPALETVARSVGAEVRSWHFDRVSDVQASLAPIAVLLAAGGIAGAPDAATHIAAAHAEAVRAPVRANGPVLFLFSVDPPMAFGTGTYVDDLWVSMGGVNAVRMSGYPAITAEDVVRLAPAAIVSIGRSSIPKWMKDASAVLVAIDAPELLEPSARMLVSGPVSLRGADDAICA